MTDAPATNELRCPSDDLIAFAITEAFGERCPTTDADCYTCQAWSQYDALRAAATPSAEGRNPALAQLDSADVRAAPWRYEVQHGPDGEADYAWVYDEANNLICTAKTHHAKAIVDRLSTGLLPDASPGNNAEKVREALIGLNASLDHWWNGDRTDRRIIDICEWQRKSAAALHSTSAAGETTSSDGQRENQPEKRTGPHRASGETNSGSTGDSELTRSAVCPSEAADVLAMKEACKQAVYEADYLKDALANIDAIEIDKLSPEVKADASPPDWKQDQAETTRIKPPATAEGGRDEPVAIKPLEWDKHPDEDEWFSHDHGLYDVSEYLVYKSPVSTTAWCLKVRGILLDEDFLGPDAAKAAAQSDYEARIRSALVVPPASPPDVEAISPLDESAIRQDEREKCAAEVERANWPCVGDARRIASAIRTGGQK